MDKLLREVTNSTGNRATWTKGHVRSDYLIAICTKFKVSADYVLGLIEKPLSENAIMIAKGHDRFDNKGQSYLLTEYYRQDDRQTAEQQSKTPVESDILAIS